MLRCISSRDSLQIFALSWSKNNNCHRRATLSTTSNAITAKRYPSTGWFSTFCTVSQWLCRPFRQRDLTTNLLGECANVGKQYLRCICSWPSHFSRKEWEGLAPTVLFLTWSTGFWAFFYSLDMWTLLRRWHFTELKFTIQQNSTEFTLHSLSGLVKLW